MSARRFASLLVLTVLSACASDRSDEGSTFHLGFPHIALPHFFGGKQRGVLEKDAEGGAPVLLWGDTSLGDTCVPIGTTQLDVVTAPLHGVIAVKSGRMYAIYPEDDPHAICSGRLVTGTLAYYTAEKTFDGADQVVLRAVRATGEVQQVTVNITVTPARAPVSAVRRKPSAPPPLTIPKPTIRDPAAPAPAVLQSPFPGG